MKRAFYHCQSQVNFFIKRKCKRKERANPMNHKLIYGAAVSIFILVAGSAFFFLKYRPEQEAAEAFRQAKVLLAENRLEEAVTELERAVSKNPRHPKAGLVLFDLIYTMDPERAGALLADLEQAASSPEDLISRKVLMALEEGNPGRAKVLSEVLNTIEDLGHDGHYARLLLTVSEEGIDEAVYRRLQELRARYPESREFQYLESRVELLRSDPMAAVKAKVGLLNLLDSVDAISLRAALTLSLQRDLPMFAEDWRRVVDHFQQHPFLDPVLRRLDLPELRRLSERFVGLRPSLAFRFTSELVSRPDAEHRDRLGHFDLALTLGKDDRLADTVEAFQARANPDPSTLLALARYTFSKGRQEDGMEYLRRVQKDFPDHRGFLRVLLELSGESGKSLETGARLQVADWLFEHPEAKVRHRLRALEIKIEEDPSGRGQVLEGAMAAFSRSAPIQLGQWLNRMGEAERVLAFLGSEEALGDPTAFFIRLEALLRSGRLNEARDFLDEEASTLSSYQRELARLQLAISLDNEESAGEHLANAIELADGEEDLRSYFVLAEFARRIEAVELVKAAYERAYLRQAVFPVQAAMNYLNLLLREDALEEAEEFAAYNRNRVPGNPIFINNDCYLQILRESSLEDCIEEMERIVTAYPDVPNYRGTLALAQLLAGYPASALDTLREGDYSFDSGNNHAQLIFAMVHAANGEATLARTVAERLNREQLNRRELALLERYFPQ